jgi:hypothetical protein
MSISKQAFEEACRKIVPEMYVGWRKDVSSLINGLQASELSKLPAAYQKAAYLNTLITLLDRLGDARKPDGSNVGNGYQLAVNAIKLCVQDFKNRWDYQVQDLENRLTFDYVNIKKSIIDAIGISAGKLLVDSPDSFLNQVIVPGVTMAGTKRLNQIVGDKMTRDYCTNLLEVSGLFNIYDSTEEGFDSVADTITKTFKTMVLRLQDIYYAVYQPRGLGDTVYSEPGVRKIKRCIEKYEAQLCAGKQNRETVAFKHLRTKGVNTLLMYAWYLEVHRDADEGVVIKLMQNPKRMSALIDTAVTDNMLWHLDELVDDLHERIAWERTMRMAA